MICVRSCDKQVVNKAEIFEYNDNHSVEPLPPLKKLLLYGLVFLPAAAVALAVISEQVMKHLDS